MTVDTLKAELELRTGQRDAWHQVAVRLQRELDEARAQLARMWQLRDCGDDCECDLHNN